MTSKIVDGAIVNADINAAAGIFGSKLAAAADLARVGRHCGAAGRLSSAIATAQQGERQTRNQLHWCWPTRRRRSRCERGRGDGDGAAARLGSLPGGVGAEVVQTGAGQVTLAPGAATLNAAVGTFSPASQWARMTLRKRGTNAWDRGRGRRRDPGDPVPCWPPVGAVG